MDASIDAFIEEHANKSVDTLVRKSIDLSITETIDESIDNPITLFTNLLTSTPIGTLISSEIAWCSRTKYSEEENIDKRLLDLGCKEHKEEVNVTYKDEEISNELKERKEEEE